MSMLSVGGRAAARPNSPACPCAAVLMKALSAKTRSLDPGRWDGASRPCGKRQTVKMEVHRQETQIAV